MPQDAVFGVMPGVGPVVRVPELPDREFAGKDIPNPDGALTPGIYCTIELRIPRKTPSFSVPADAIIFDRTGMQWRTISGGTE